MSTCSCEKCNPPGLMHNIFTMCPDCGNKRCPKGTDHDNECTNSNEPGQKGSSWEDYYNPPSLEMLVNRKWGHTMFDWIIGRCSNLGEEKWFWYCGTSPATKKAWKHGGLADTIDDALQAMLEVE